AMVAEDVEEWLYTVLRRDLKITDSRLNLSIWVRQVQDRKLVKALFKRRGPDGRKYDLIAMAEEADLRVDLPRRQVLLRMRRGTVISPETNGGAFRDHVWTIPLPDSFQLEKPNRPFDLTWEELMQRGDELARVA